MEDLGDLASVTFRPDPDHPRLQNVGLVEAVARQVADRVDQAVASGRVPLVLGGDCSLSLGVMAGLLRHHRRIGLVYFDADLDLNTPATTSSGVADGMVLAHALGRGAPELTGVGPQGDPLLCEEDIVLFGYDVGSGWIDAPEIEWLERSNMSRYPLPQIRPDAASAARDALGALPGHADSFLVHFDIDVTDTPAVDVQHPGGLDAESAFAALSVFAAAPGCAALVVTELNPERDPDGSHTERLVDGLVTAVSSGVVGDSLTERARATPESGPTE